MYKLIEKSIDLGDGRSIVIETGKLAKQADGSVVVKMGRTMLLATVVAQASACASHQCPLPRMSHRRQRRHSSVASTGVSPMVASLKLPTRSAAGSSVTV